MNTNAVNQTISIESGSAVVDVIVNQARIIRELQEQNEQLKLVASYAKDVVDFWPEMTMRTIRLMIPKMDALKEALGLLNK